MSTFDLAEHNKALIKEICDAVSRGDPRLFHSHLSPHASIAVAGKYPWSHVEVGKERIRHELYDYVRSRLSERGKTHTINFLANGDWVVVEARGDVVLESGVPYRNDYCLCYRLEDDLIVEIKEYQASSEHLLGLSLDQCA